MKLALGTVQFGLNYGITNLAGCVSEDDVGRILLRAKACNMDTLDTAIAYGKSEEVLGRVGIQSWKVITKLPAVPDACPDIKSWVNVQIRQSMERLGVIRIYGLLLHRPIQLLDPLGPALYAALIDIKAQGLVDKIGVSIYEPAELKPLLDRYTVDLVQAPVNILDRRLIETGWAESLRKAGVEVHSRSALLQGLLLMAADTRPAKFSRWADVFDVWDSWQLETGLTPLQACLRYVNECQDLDRVLVGVASVDQLEEIINALDGPLPSLPKFEPLKDTRLINPASWNML